MTPAIALCDKENIAVTIHRYEHDPRSDSYGLEVAEKLPIAAEKVFKTLVVTDGRHLYVALLPITQSLSLKKLAQHIGVKKIAMADKQVVANKTGYQIGGVSPLAQKQLLPTFIDASAQVHAQIFVSAGQRGLEIEIATADLAKLTQATFAVLTG